MTGPASSPQSLAPPQMTAAQFATLVAWGSLAGAHGELAARAVLATGRSFESNFHINLLAIGVGPAVNLTLFLVIAGIAWGAARVVRPRRAFAAVVFAVSALVALEVLLITQRVLAAALAILAAGCAAVATRLAVRHSRRVLQFVRVSTVIMAVAAIGGSIYLSTRPSLAEERALASVAGPPPGSPNVLVLILDTVRAIELGAYGNPRPVSPHLDSLARTAVRFDYAFSTAPWTLPSHASMLSGRYAHELSTDWVRPYDGAYPLITELLRDKGYATGAFVGNLIYLSRRWGLDRGFNRYEDYQVDPTVLWSTSSLTGFLVRGLLNTPSRHRVMVNGTSASLIRERFMSWQQSLGERPFFAFLNFFDAHAPYGAPAPFDTMFLGRRPRFYQIDRWSQRGKEENEELRANYDQAIAWVDSQVGALIADLRQRGVLDRTLLIITSDHGEEFGEHGYSGHGSSLHTTQSRVPLLIVPPGWRGSREVGEFVTLRDLAATIAEGATLPPGTVPGTSLSRHWESTDTVARDVSPILVEVTARANLKPWYPSARGSLRSIIDGGMSYTMQVGVAGGEWLYDVVRDPLEQHDLSRIASYADTLTRLRSVLNGARGVGATAQRAGRP